LSASTGITGFAIRGALASNLRGMRAKSATTDLKDLLPNSSAIGSRSQNEKLFCPSCIFRPGAGTVWLKRRKTSNHPKQNLTSGAKDMIMNKIWASFLLTLLVCMTFAVANSNAAGAAETRIKAQLAGAALNGMTPKGRAEFRARATNNQLNVQVENVNLPDGTILNVLVNDAQIGQLSLTLRKGEMQLNSGDGQIVPSLTLGSTIVVTDEAGRTIVAGAF
jgi:hypothetical protein